MFHLTCVSTSSCRALSTWVTVLLSPTAVRVLLLLLLYGHCIRFFVSLRPVDPSFLLFNVYNAIILFVCGCDRPFVIYLHIYIIYTHQLEYIPCLVRVGILLSQQVFELQQREKKGESKVRDTCTRTAAAAL